MASSPRVASWCTVDATRAASSRAASSSTLLLFSSATASYQFLAAVPRLCRQACRILRVLLPLVQIVTERPHLSDSIGTLSDTLSGPTIGCVVNHYRIIGSLSGHYRGITIGLSDQGSGCERVREAYGFRAGTLFQGGRPGIEIGQNQLGGESDLNRAQRAVTAGGLNNADVAYAMR